MTWDRIQRLELELAERDRRNRELEELVERASAISVGPSLAPIRTAAVMLITSLEDQRDQAIGERDRARSIAVRLEQELAQAEAQLEELLSDG